MLKGTPGEEIKQLNIAALLQCCATGRCFPFRISDGQVTAFAYVEAARPPDKEQHKSWKGRTETNEDRGNFHGTLEVRALSGAPLGTWKDRIHRCCRCHLEALSVRVEGTVTSYGAEVTCILLYIAFSMGPGLKASKSSLLPCDCLWVLEKEQYYGNI